MAPLFEVLARIPHREGELPTLELDAPSLVHQCARHGVSAYVADALARAKVTLPPPYQQQLTDDARATVSQGVKNKRLLLNVLDVLAARGVTPIVLKGYGLATRLYDSPLVRPSTDVDILVLPSDLPLVHAALGSIGLTHRPDPSLGDVLEEHHHEAFSGPAGLVEVHFRLFAGFGMATYDDHAVQSRAWPSQLDRRAVRYLGAEDEFLYLAVHAANHAFLRASWLVDLQRFAQKSPPQWERVAQLAKQVGFTVPYAAALDVLQVAFDRPLSAQTRQTAGHQHLRPLVHERLFSPAHLAAADFAEGRFAPYLIRVWLVDSPARGLTQLLGGAKRFARRQWDAARSASNGPTPHGRTHGDSHR